MRSAHLGDQALEAGTLGGTVGGLPQILINHHHLCLGPTKRQGPVDQSVLEPGRLRAPAGLLGARLPDIHPRQALVMRTLNLGARQGTDTCRWAHRGPPPLAIASLGTASPSGSAEQSAAAVVPEARAAISELGHMGS